MTDVTPISKQQRQVLWLQDQKPAGTNGGASVVASLPDGQVRDLNTVRKNTIPGASLNATTGFFTLPAGTYTIQARSAYGGTNNRALILLFNETLGGRLLRGPHSGISNNTQADRPEFFGDFVVTATEELSIRQINAGASSPSGLGNIFGIGGNIEIFTDVFIEKVRS